MSKEYPSPSGEAPPNYTPEKKHKSPDNTAQPVEVAEKQMPSPDGTAMSYYDKENQPTHTPDPEALAKAGQKVVQPPTQYMATYTPHPQHPIYVKNTPQTLPMRHIRILYVTSNTLIGGAETVLKRLIQGLDKTLYDIEVLVTHERGPLHDEYAEAAKLTYLPNTDNLESQLLDKVRQGNYDYVHFFNHWMLYDTIPQLVKENPKTRIMVSLFADFYGHKNVPEWAGYIRKINMIQPLLYALTTDALVNKNVWHSIQVIRNGVPVETFSPAAKDPQLVVWVGRMQNTKRPQRFLELAQRLPDYKFIMVGDSETEVAAELKAEHPPNLEIRIGLTEREVSDLLAHATYYVFTSMTEGAPLSILEAMSAGCCVICEQVGDVPQMVTHEETGYLVPRGQVDTAEWIATCLQSFNVKVGEEARRVVLADYNLDNMVKQYEHLYGAVGDHHNQTRIAFVWGMLPHHGNFWETKVDSHQYAIAELSKRNVVGVYVPSTDNQPASLLHGQSYTYYKESDPYNIIEQLRIFKPDAIYLNMFWDPRWPLIVKEFPAAWKALVHFGEEYLHVPWANQINLFIAQQQFMADKIAEANDLPPDRVTTIPFCMEQWLFKPLPREKTYTGIMVSDFRRDIKRQHLLIEAWRDIPGQLVLVGPYERSMPKDYHETCKALARRLGVEDRVVFVDGYPHVDLPELINKAKIGFLTSSHEGGSRSLIEQMACGLPEIVLSDCEGNVSMIRDGEEGYVADPTPKSIAEATNRLLAGDWVAMGKAASERALREYPYHRMSLQYKELTETAFPEVSIITTSMNRGKFLEDCIASVQVQRGARVNHIIMDGGSTDNTPTILKEYRGRVHAYVGRCSGQTDAIVRAVRLIEDQFPQTRYLGWINADDYYTPQWLEWSLKTLQDSPPDVALVSGDAGHVNEDGSPRQTLNYTPDPYITLTHLCLRGNIIIQPTVLIKLDALQKLRTNTGMTWNPDYHYTQDLELWIRFMHHGYRAAKLGKITANLRSHPLQMSLTHMDQQIVERDRLLRALSIELGLPNPGWVRG